MNALATVSPAASAADAYSPWGMAWRLARREMRGGLGGLRLLAVCLFLGVLALSAVGSLTASIVGGLASQGQEVLGGDLQVRLTQRLPTPAERAALQGYGRTADVIRMRAMVSADDKQLLGELKAVDGGWPLYGTAQLRGRPADNADVQRALAAGAVLAGDLADQLGVKVGDRVRIGEAELPVTGVLAVEPDRAGEGFQLGPTAMVGMAALERTRLVQPGSLYQSFVRVKMPPAADPAAAADALRARFPDAGWRITDRSDGAPGVRRFIERLGQFLTLVGLTSLAVAGVGVGNGVASYLDRKGATVAVLKTLGASSGLITRSYLLAIVAVSVAAAAAGALIGALAPWVVVQVAGDLLPVPPQLGLHPGAAAERLRERFPDAGWRITDRSDGAPGVRRFIERLGQFLTLVGLTSLAVAGVGVGNGVASYLDRKGATVAVLKTLGASSGLITRSYLLAIVAVSVAAAAAGALIGALAPWVVVQVAGDLLPVPPQLGLHPGALLTAIAFGLLVAVAFALPPLARAGALPANRLLRGQVEAWPWPSRRTLLLSGAAGLLVMALAVAQARDELFAAGFLAATAALIALLWALAWGVRRVAARLPRPRGTLARLALANLHRPGNLTRQLVVALGLGLTLFATLAFIETSFRGELQRTVPERAPGFFLLDLPKEDGDAFRALVQRTSPGAGVNMVPSLRGPVVAVNGVPVSKMTVPDGAWILRGDRGLTFSATLPEGNSIVEGRWWPADYAGPPLVSVDEEPARQLGLKPGDTLTVSVLGTEVTATVANLRRVNWDGLGLNFALVFDPNSLGGAPYTWLATIKPKANAAAVVPAVTRAFPTASIVDVRDVLGQVSTLFTQLGAAVRVAASVAILAGIAVLVGALAAQARARIYDSVILKVLGATRRQILASAVMEYAALGLIVAGLALGLGALAAWVVVVQVLDLTWQPDWMVALLTVVAGAAVTLLLGMIGAARALGAKPNAVLREL